MRRILLIDVSKKDYSILERESLGVLEDGIYFHKYFYRSYLFDVYHENNVLVFGCGPLAKTDIFGTHRLTFVFRSPLTRTLYVSTCGGAALELYRSGFDCVVIYGKSENPLFIGIKDGKIKFEEVKIKEEYFKGIPEILKDFKEKMKDFLGERFRVISVGPASFSTNFGCIFSCEIPFKYEDFAGRGGGGSVLFRAHNILAIGFTGSRKIEHFDLKSVFEEKGKEYPKFMNEATKKYRYDERLGTGGTFGCNYPLLKTFVEFENWTMIYKDEKERAKIFEEKIMSEKWWKSFQKEVIENKKFEGCGDICNVLCKKIYKGKKTDYEPFQAFGPNIGIFDIEVSKEIVDFVDKMGFDAIEAGNICSFVLELDKLGFLKLEGNSIKEKVMIFLRRMINGEENVENLRIYSNLLNARDFAVYVAYGEEGAITPNFYWSLGVLIPLPLAGRYWTYYHFGEFLDPEELAKKCYFNGVKECLYDDFGICRFHRKWISEMLSDLILKVTGETIDVNDRGRRLLREVYEYNLKAKAYPVFWESKRVKDIIRSLAKVNKSPWEEKLREEEGFREYWNRFWITYEKLLEERFFEFCYEIL